MAWVLPGPVPMRVVEAQAVGRAVVTSNCSSMPEVANEAACLVDPMQVGSIRVGIRKIIEDTEYREHLVTLGFNNANRYLLARTAKQYADLYRQVACETASSTR